MVTQKASSLKMKDYSMHIRISDKVGHLNRLTISFAYTMHALMMAVTKCYTFDKQTRPIYTFLNNIDRLCCKI